MSEPRNVTPGPELKPDEFHRRYYNERSEGPEWAGWSWASRGWNFPWLGVLLVLLAIALAFLAAWVFGRSWAALVPGLLLLAIVVARLLDEMNIYRGSGTTALSLAGAFLLIWLIGYTRGRRSTWPLWGLAIFGLIGLVQISGRIAGIPELGALWPIVIILLGVLLLLSSRR